MRIIKIGLGVFGVVVAATVLTFGLLGLGTTSAAPGPGGGDKKDGIFANYQTVLAQKLGITVDALKAAQKATHDQLIDNAVAAGKLTKAQGDALKSGQKPPHGTPGQGNTPGTPGQQGPGGMRGAMQGLKDIMGQHETVLAQKLNITVDKLKAAQKAARDELVDQAVAAGKLTKAQADAIKSGQKPSGGPGGPGGAGGLMGPGGLHDGIGDAMKAAATALKTTPEELRAALRNGQSLAEFAQSKGIGRDALRSTIMGSVQNEVNAAVRDGKITAQQGTAIIEGVSKSLDRLLDQKFGGPGQNRPGQGVRPGQPGQQGQQGQR
jgi:polyhydroxyalkanoate synthesis regulator phasin